MTRLSHPVALALLASLASPSAPCDIYAYTDGTGTVSLSNLPDDARYRVVVADPPDPTDPSTAPAAERAGLRRAYDTLIEAASHAYGLSSALLHAVVTVESRYNAKARSPRGAQGLMQLMPGTARRYGVIDPFDPAQNLAGGARYLRDLLRRFDDDLSLALAAYNAGEGAVAKYGNRIPPYRETRAYVPKVVEHYRRYQAQQGMTPAPIETEPPHGPAGEGEREVAAALPTAQLQGFPRPTAGFPPLQSQASSLD